MHNRDDLLRKAAILLASLEAVDADALLKRLPAADADRIKQATIRLAALDDSEQQNVFDEFLNSREVHSPLGPAASGDGVELDDRLAGRIAAWDEHSKPELSGASECTSSEFSALSELDGSTIASLLKDEHPQTLALVVSHLTAKKAAEVLQHVTANVRSDILARVAGMDEADPVTTATLRRELDARRENWSRARRQKAKALSTVANILTAVEQNTRESTLEGPLNMNSAVVLETEEKPTEFHEIENWSKDRLAEVLRDIPLNLWATALKGASEGLFRRALSCLTPETAQRLKSAVCADEAVRLNDIEDAQRIIEKLLQDLRERRERPATGQSLSVAA
jgi:flagellar motor switch protein FliG